MDENLLISIIVPVYNVEKYLEKCLNSIINQTYKNIEIICIDDGSPDNSIYILNRFAKKDKRIKIIRQKNQGLSAARNIGINNATGKYIIFVDSDDWLELNTLELLYEKLLVKEFDFICFGVFKNFENVEERVFQNISENYEDGLIFFKESYLKNCFTASACNKIYLKDFLVENLIYFTRGKLYEDLLFTFECLKNSKNIGVIKTPLYHYFIKRENSITNKINKKDLDALFIVEEIEKKLIDKNKEFVESLEFREYIFSWLSKATVIKTIFNTKLFDKTNDKIIDFYLNNYKYKEYCDFLVNKKTKRKYKVLIKLLYSNLFLSKVLIKVNEYKILLFRKIKYRRK